LLFHLKFFFSPPPPPLPLPPTASQPPDDATFGVGAVFSISAIVSISSGAPLPNVRASIEIANGPGRAKLAPERAQAVTDAAGVATFNAVFSEAVPGKYTFVVSAGRIQSPPTLPMTVTNRVASVSIVTQPGPTRDVRLLETFKVDIDMVHVDPSRVVVDGDLSASSPSLSSSAAVTASDHVGIISMVQPVVRVLDAAGRPVTLAKVAIEVDASSGGGAGARVEFDGTARTDKLGVYRARALRITAGNRSPTWRLRFVCDGITSAPSDPFPVENRLQPDAGALDNFQAGALLLLLVFFPMLAATSLWAHPVYIAVALGLAVTVMVSALNHPEVPKLFDELTDPFVATLRFINITVTVVSVAVFFTIAVVALKAKYIDRARTVNLGAAWYGSTRHEAAMEHVECRMWWFFFS
jgi:hypothetical protein